MICFPNAKINLGLHVVSKRLDGYHDLETVFYPIGLKDALEIVPSTHRVKRQLSQTGIRLDSSAEENLVMKAYDLLNASFSLDRVDIYLHKTIPSGAGLGGGSSDAAFMLKLLNEYQDLNLSDRDLQTLASTLGADCPFFIENRPVYATGIGNVFEPICLSLKGYYLVLVKPDVMVSTKDAYSMVTPAPSAFDLRELATLPLAEWRSVLKNDFEPSVFARYPMIATIREQLYNRGAVYASMSGSGSSVYGIFDNKPLIDNEFDGNFVWTGQMW